MNLLEQEAREYANTLTKNNTYKSYLVNAVKFGANSKYVQAEKIKAQMFLLQKIDSSEKETLDWFLKNKFKQLEKQLKQLEDEK